MKKFAANYLITENGWLLKNGIIVAEDDGSVLEFIDTQGNLRETGLLAFHNGILLAGFELEKVSEIVPVPESPLMSFLYPLVSDSGRIGIHEFFEVGKQVQNQFPEMTISEILRELFDSLLTAGNFIIKKVTGVFLITGADLPNLKFTSKSRIKKLL